MQWDLLLTYRAWAIESGFFERVYPIITEMYLKGLPGHFGMINLNRKLYHGIDPSVVKTGGYHAWSTPEDPIADKQELEVTEKKKVAVIPVLGTLAKHDGLSSYGMHTYIMAINQANNNNNIGSIVLIIESPGGSVDGTPEFAKAVRESKKPVVVFGDGMVASAAYWVASQAKAIFGNADNYTDFGSIGALYVYENWAKYIENEIGEIRIIRAPQSKDKALINPIEPLQPAQEKEIKDELKSITDFFIETVKSGRGEKLKAKDSEIFTGKMFDRETSLQMGLIDQIGTLQDAVNYAQELAVPRKPANNNPKQNSTSMKKIFSYLFGGKAEDKPKDGELSAEDKAEVEAAEQKLAELRNEKASLQSQIDSLKAEKSGLEAKITEKDAEITKLKAELAKAPAGQKTTAVGAQDRGPEMGGKKDDYKTSVDAEVEAYRASMKEVEETK